MRLCRHCGDRACAFDSDTRPVCLECFLEKECDILVIQNIAPPPSRSSLTEEESPGWHDIVRTLEDWVSAH